jgi:shikimate kinase
MHDIRVAHQNGCCHNQAMRVVLVGYRGCGKTSIGQKLADKLWADFYDADQVLVADAGMSIRNIFATYGEAHFRDLETAVLEKLLIKENAVVSTGGGVVLKQDNRDKLTAASHSRIYLRCDAAELHRRIENDPHSAQMRPALTSLGGLAEVESQLARREPLYRCVMTAELDVTHLSIDEAVQRIGRLI